MEGTLPGLAPIFWREAHHHVNMVRLDILLHLLDLQVSLPNLVHLDHQILVYPLDQYFKSTPWYPYDVIKAGQGDAVLSVTLARS